MSKEDVEEFMECDTCRAKPGSPYLCRGCLHNRTLINKLTPLVAQNTTTNDIKIKNFRCSEHGSQKPEYKLFCPKCVAHKTVDRETLAELEHEQWIAWSRDIAATEKITPARLARWSKLWRPYADLTETEKDQDREWADKVLAVLAQKEQKEGIGTAIDRAGLKAKNAAHLINNSAPLMTHNIEKDGCDGLADCPVCPTPTVKEESHTQGWVEEVNRLVRDFTKVGASKSFVRAELDKLIKEVASQEYERGKSEAKNFEERWISKDQFETFTHAAATAGHNAYERGVEAGRLQGIADAVAVVPEVKLLAIDMHGADNGVVGGWNACRQTMLTALSSLTHKE